ncbi:MAG TPA: hypothetical protein VFV89_15055 [Nocardioides sp.]|uniref:hypothetical protein n=1 Tax=Nocardioides sp. TaxID=35761 RepID=UPI002E36F21F|nr:hypothetical protein [Nocardioides sp.]HEX5089125.1 hypothetical protein [Nocardioides sp.]
MEIRLARTRFDLFATGVLVGYAAIFTALVWAATLLLDGHDVALGMALVVLTVLWLLWSGLYVFTWTRMRRVDVPLELHASGVFARGQFGTLEVPWAAVRSATVERTWNGRRLRIRLVPPTSPEHAGIVNHVNDRMMKVVDKEGMRYSLRVLAIGEDELREAFTVRSGGRVRVG